MREGIRTEAIRVDVATNIWSDYVFEKDYKLRSISEVESFIKNKKHLPGIPSAAEVVNTGIDLAEYFTRTDQSFHWQLTTPC